MRVFISYSHHDREIAAELAKSLSKLGYDPWLADQELLPGENWSLAIGRALEQADSMVVLVSSASAKSDWQSREVQYALASPRFQGRVVSVLVPPMNRIPTHGVPWILRKLTVIESGKTASETSKRIAKALREDKYTVSR